MDFTKRTTPKIALTLAGLFFIVAISYSLVIPIFEASDETLHYPYVKYLADGKGLPVAGRDLLLKQEATQGPIFYLLAALATFWIDTDNLEVLLDYNPHWPDSTSRPLNDNQNLIAHGSADRFPYQGAARALHIARIVSILFGTTAVICIPLIAAQLFPDQLWLALGAGALAAFNPQFIRTSATVSNDAASTAFVALLALLALRWRRADLTIWRVIGLGGVAGLAVLTKLNGVIGLGLVGVILILWKAEHLPWPTRIRQLGEVGGVAALVAGWWFIRNWQLYGEWTANDIHLNLAGRGYLSFGEIISLWGEIENTFWASFGWGQIRVAEWIYTALRWTRYVATVGLALFLVRLWSVGVLKRVGVLTIWLLVGLGLLFRWISLVGSVSHARLLFPALPAVAILGMLGLGQWVPAKKNWRLILSFCLTIIFLLFAIASLVICIVPAYTPPSAIRNDEIPVDLPVLDLTYVDGIRLLTADVAPETVAPGETFMLDVFWQGVRKVDKNYSLFIRVLDADRTPLIARDTYPGLGLLPTKHWPLNFLVRDRYPLTLPTDFSDGPLVADIVVGLFDFQTETRAGYQAINIEGEIVYPRVAQVKIVPRVWPNINPQYPLAVTFAEYIYLAGYDWDCAEDCRLRLYWRAMGRPTNAYTVFIQHWVDGDQAGGFDSPPRLGSYPTDWWTENEVIVDPHHLPLLDEGVLFVGLYNLETGSRVPILGANIPHHDNGLIIEVP